MLSSGGGRRATACVCCQPATSVWWFNHTAGCGGSFFFLAIDSSIYALFGRVIQHQLQRHPPLDPTPLQVQGGLLRVPRYQLTSPDLCLLDRSVHVGRERD
jgi:hypothetical protein